MLLLLLVVALVMTSATAILTTISTAHGTMVVIPTMATSAVWPAWLLLLLLGILFMALSQGVVGTLKCVVVR